MSNNLLFVHESNITTKIQNHYRGVGDKLLEFLNGYYYPMRREIDTIDFTSQTSSTLREQSDHNSTPVIRDCFIKAARVFNQYFQSLNNASMQLNITSQSKFESTYYEEISTYLFRDLPEIKSGQLSFFNKGIYAGMKFDNHYQITTIKKDVDFCILDSRNTAL